MNELTVVSVLSVDINNAALVLASHVAVWNSLFKLLQDTKSHVALASISLSSVLIHGCSVPCFTAAASRRVSTTSFSSFLLFLKAGLLLAL